MVDNVKLKTSLFPYQVDEVSRLVRKKRWILVEKTGKGKSLVALSTFINLYNRGKLDLLYVTAPKNAYDLKVWKSECHKHTTMKCIDLEELYQKTGGSIERLRKLVPYYQMVYSKHSHVNTLKDFIKDLLSSCRVQVVVDEGHKLKNPKSTLTLNSKIAYLNAFSLGLMTATPLSKNMEDCYNIINFVKPWFLGTFDQFKKEFCVTKSKVIGRTYNGGLRKVDEIIGIKSIQNLHTKLDPLVIRGSSLFDLKWDYLRYEMGKEESSIYRRLAKGMFTSTVELTNSEDWFKYIMSGEDSLSYQVGDVERHSSRFIYLQYVADGIISDNGDIGMTHKPEPVYGEKIKKALLKLKEIYEKGESCLIYFDYYATLDTFKYFLSKFDFKFKVLEMSARSQLKETDISEVKVKQHPHLILATKAGSESFSFYYMNHVMFFNIPTVPSTFVQFVGRICRANTLYPEDLNCHLLLSDNIDFYKLLVVCNKAYQMEAVSNEEKNIPPDFKDKVANGVSIEDCKKYLLWDQSSSGSLMDRLIRGISL